MDITEIKKGLDGIKIIEEFFEEILKEVETETNGCFANIKAADSEENITENKTVKKPYSGHVYCLRSNNSNIINRYVYSIKDGYIEDSAGWLTPIYNRKRKIITSFEEFMDSLGGKWIEVKDIEEKDDKEKDYTDVVICVDNKNKDNYVKYKEYYRNYYKNNKEKIKQYISSRLKDNKYRMKKQVRNMLYDSFKRKNKIKRERRNIFCHRKRIS